jgi:hypothetical protein
MKRKSELDNVLYQDLLREFISLESDEARTGLLVNINENGEALDAIFYQAAIDNSINAFVYCLSSRTLSQILEAFDLASSKGHSNIIFKGLQHINENFQGELPDIITDLMYKEASKENFDFVTLLIQEVTRIIPDELENIVNEVFCGVAKYGPLKAVQFLSDSALPLNEGQAILEAANTSQIEIIDYIVNNFKKNSADLKTILDDALGVAAECGHIILVQYLIEKNAADPSADNNYAIYNAYGHKHVNIALYLASFPCVLQSLDEHFLTELDNLKRTMKAQELTTYGNSYVNFFPSASELNKDINQNSCPLSLNLIQKELDQSNEVFGFILK